VQSVRSIWSALFPFFQKVTKSFLRFTFVLCLVRHPWTFRAQLFTDPQEEFHDPFSSLLPVDLHPPVGLSGAKLEYRKDPSHFSFRLPLSPSDHYCSIQIVLKSEASTCLFLFLPTSRVLAVPLSGGSFSMRVIPTV